MVIEEQLNENLVRHYSDEGLYILQVETGVEYCEAVDAIPCRYSYVETEKKIDKIGMGYPEGYDEGYDEGYAKADNENPFYYIKDMGFRFTSRIFSAEKSNVVCRVLDCKAWNMAFGQLSGIKTLKIICDTQGLSVVWAQLVRQSADLELLDLTEFECYPTTIAHFAYDTPNLKTILGALDLSQCTAVTNAFGGANSLEEVRFVPNTIKISIEFQWCTKLSKASLISIINGLSAETSGLTVTLSKTAVNKAFETIINGEGQNNGSINWDWQALVANKTNWTINLV